MAQTLRNLGNLPLLNRIYICKVTSIVSNSLRPYELSPLVSSVGFSRLEYWSGLPFPTSGDLPDPGIKLMSLTSPELVGKFFATSTT